MPYLPKVMLKTPLFTRFQPKKSDENLPKPQKYFFQFFFVLKPKNWRKQIWSRIEFYNMWYVYLTFEVSWTEKSQNIEFPDFPLFLIFAQLWLTPEECRQVEARPGRSLRLWPCCLPPVSSSSLPSLSLSSSLTPVSSTSLSWLAGIFPQWQNPTMVGKCQ